MAREDFAVRGMMPEMNPYEVSPLAVQGPVAAQDQTKANLLATPGVTVVPGSLDDLSQFGGLGGLDGYEANFSNAFGGSGSGQSSGPMSYAFPENYGNPKNKVYNLTAGPEDNIRLKFVDGTTMFEGKGPEAAAKAAAIVQELGKKFNTQSTWILDKQTAGGDWKQVSQDTVGTKKKTALNSFLDVVAPIAGSLLAVVPGLGLVSLVGKAGAAAAGAAGGSLLNSGLQNQNSAEAFKKAALAAAGTFVGAKLGEVVSGVTGGGNVTNASSAGGIRDLAAKGFSPEQILQEGLKFDPLMKLADVTSVLSGGAASGVGSAADLVIKGVTNAGTGALTSAVTGGLGSAVAGGLDAATSGVTNAATNTSSTGTDSNEVVVTGQEGSPLDTAVGYDIAGGLGGNGVTSGVNTDFVAQPDEVVIEADKTPVDQPTVAVDPNLVVNTGTPVNPTPDTTVVTAEPKPVDQPVVAVDPNLVVNTGTPVNPTPDTTTVTGPKKPVEQPVVAVDPNLVVDTGTPVNPTPDTTTVTGPKKEEPVILPDGTLNPAYVDTPIVVPPTAPPTVETPPKTTTKFNPKTLLPLVPLVTGLVDGGDGGGGGGGNTLTYPGGTKPGTPGSLTSTFTAKLPTPDPALAVTPRDMGQRDWLRYGFGPEASFFSNVPDRQALAVNPAPAAQMTPAAQTSPAPVAQTSPLAVNPTPSPTIAAMPALSEKLNEPTPDLAVKVDESAMPEPEEITTSAPASNQYTEAQWAALERSDPTAYRDAIMSGEHGFRKMYARGGRTGGTSRKPRTEFAVHGAGTGRSDDIPAVLSDGEYVMDAETVALLGDGSSKAGAEKLDQLRVNLRRHKGANLAKGRFSVNAKSPEKYLAGGRV